MSDEEFLLQVNTVIMESCVRMLIVSNNILNRRKKQKLGVDTEPNNNSHSLAMKQMLGDFANGGYSDEIVEMEIPKSCCDESIVHMTKSVRSN